MKRQEETAQQRAWRKYNEKHKEEIKNSKLQFNTTLPKEDANEINEFLKKYNLKKVDLIYTGYLRLKEIYETNKK